MLPGEIGCYHSHIGAWREFLAGDDDVLLILEDDVVFGVDFIPALQEALRVREHWDFLKLNKIRRRLAETRGIGPRRL